LGILNTDLLEKEKNLSHVKYWEYVCYTIDLNNIFKSIYIYIYIYIVKYILYLYLYLSGSDAKCKFETQKFEKDFCVHFYHKYTEKKIL